MANPTAPPVDAAPARLRGQLLVAVGIGVAIAAGVVLRFAARSDLWLDEALTVNIAKLPFGDIAPWLKHDGAPPLFYWLLHAWISVFGDSDPSVRALPAVFGLASIPVAYFAGKRIGGPRVGWITVVLIATSPFAIRYSFEVRMYSLVTLLALFAFLALLRLFDRPTVLRALLLALVVALGMYTNYWAIYLAIAVGIGLLCIVWRGRDEWRRPAWFAIGALALAALAFVPWLPTFLYQSKHTGTPWGAPVVPTSGFFETLVGFGGGPHAEGSIIVLVFALLVGLALFGRSLDDWRIELDLHTRPGVRLLLAAFAGGLGVGLVVSYVGGGAFQVRYASAVFPLLVIAVAFGVTILVNRTAQAVVVALLVVVGLIGGVRTAAEQRTQAGAVAAAIRADHRPGDLVVYCPDQLGPSVARLLPTSYAQITYPAGTRPEFVDWVDYEARNDRADPAAFVRKAAARLGPDGRVFYVWFGAYRTFAGKCESLYNAIAAVRPTVTQLVAPDADNFQPMQLDQFAPAAPGGSSGTP